MRIQWNFPNTWECARWASAALAFMRDLKIQCIRPDGDGYWGHSNGTIVYVTKVFQNLNKINQIQINDNVM